MRENPAFIKFCDRFLYQAPAEVTKTRSKDLVTVEEPDFMVAVIVTVVFVGPEQIPPGQLTPATASVAVWLNVAVPPANVAGQPAVISQVLVTAHVIVEPWAPLVGTVKLPHRPVSLWLIPNVKLVNVRLVESAVVFAASAGSTVVVVVVVVVAAAASFAFSSKFEQNMPAEMIISTRL